MSASILTNHPTTSFECQFNICHNKMDFIRIIGSLSFVYCYLRNNNKVIVVIFLALNFMHLKLWNKIHWPNKNIVATHYYKVDVLRNTVFYKFDKVCFKMYEFWGSKWVDGIFTRINQETDKMLNNFFIRILHLRTTQASTVQKVNFMLYKFWNQ